MSSGQTQLRKRPAWSGIQPCGLGIVGLREIDPAPPLPVPWHMTWCNVVSHVPSGDAQYLGFLSEEAQMALSRDAREFAAEIANHDWSDAPYRCDRAGHDRSIDRTTTQQLTPAQTDAVRANVMWVVAQVLGHADPNFDEYEFAEACGVNTRTRSGRRDGSISAGLRRTSDGRFCRPGTWDEPVD